MRFVSAKECIEIAMAITKRIPPRAELNVFLSFSAALCTAERPNSPNGRTGRTAELSTATVEVLAEAVAESQSFKEVAVEMDLLPVLLLVDEVDSSCGGCVACY